jgi:hypothetical protein
MAGSEHCSSFLIYSFHALLSDRKCGDDINLNGAAQELAVWHGRDTLDMRAQ